MYRNAIHVVQREKGVSRKAHIDIHGETVNCEGSGWLAYNRHSAYSGWNNIWLSVIIFLWNSPHTCHEERNRFILIISNTNARGVLHLSMTFHLSKDSLLFTVHLFSLFSLLFSLYFTHTTTLVKTLLLRIKGTYKYPLVKGNEGHKDLYQYLFVVQYSYFWN
jgi:hypothetical protein